MNLKFLKRLYLFLERGVGREKERERKISLLPLACPLLGTWLVTQACAPTGNRTSNLLFCKPTLNPLSHTSQGEFKVFILKKQKGYSDVSLKLHILVLSHDFKNKWSFQCCNQCGPLIISFWPPLVFIGNNYIWILWPIWFLILSSIYRNQVSLDSVWSHALG